MASDQTMPKANIRVPSNLQEAAVLLAKERDYESRNDDWSKARVIREALKLYLPQQADLPQEAKDLLDDDMIANAGGDELDIEVEGVKEA